jgi:uncharacterized protein YjbI with pentapeptide repeats
VSEDRPDGAPTKGFFRRTSLGQKSLWDWINLLIVPAVIAIGGFWIEWQVGTQQREFEKQRAEQAQTLQEQRAQEEALQAYLGQMSELILAHDVLRCDVEEEQCYEARTLAEARTETVIQRLNSDLNQHLIDFLWGADLLGVKDPLEDPETEAKQLKLLSNAPLSGVDLARTNLIEVDLSLSDLSGANLHEAHLYKTILDEAHLNNADLSNAYMVAASLGGTNLYKADLSGADLRDAFVSAHLRDADLRDANLSRVDLSASDLRGANLRGAKLIDAKLIDAATMAAGKEDPSWPEKPWGGADLRDADLSGAYKTTQDGSKQLITEAELEQQTTLLEGATMPDGSKHP